VIKSFSVSKISEKAAKTARKSLETSKKDNVMRPETQQKHK